MKPSVVALGMACPLGLRAAPACAAIRAGLNRHEELPYDADGRQPLVGSMLDAIPAHVPRHRRWLALAACALVDMLGAQTAEILAQVPLLLAVPESASSAEQLAAELCRELEISRAGSMLRIYTGGPSAGLRALADARTRLEHGHASACAVVAADSLISARTLLQYHQHRRLLVEGNLDGFVPGEAAACVLVQAASRHSHPHTWGTVLGLGAGLEPARLDNDIPMRASGLLAACQAALREAGLAAHELDWRIGDATGESDHFKEQALLPTRLLRRRKADFPLWLPATSLGHVGTAAGLCGVVIALDALARGYAPGRRALICARSDDGERMAAIVEGA